MKAWLLTWETYTVTPAEHIVAVLTSRRSTSAVAELMEFLVLRANAGAKSAAYYANRRRELVYRAQTPLGINGVPHGDRIMCGHDPWLYGRIVSQLEVKVDNATKEEIVSWQEPRDLRWEDESARSVVTAREGKRKTVRRLNRPLSQDVSSYA